MKELKQKQPLLDIWFDYAAENLQVARVLMGNHFEHYSAVCYHTVTSAEKYLKAYLLDYDENPGKTHDLLQILKYCYNHDSVFARILPAVVVLNSLTIAGLHPEELTAEEVTREDAQDAVKAAEEVESFIRDIMAA